MKNRVIILIITLFLAGIGFAEAGTKRADRFFEQFRYAKAIPLYKRAAESKSVTDQKVATARLADCYRLTGDIREARSWYAKAVAFENPDPINYYYYGQSLQGVGQYEQARAAYLKYSELVPGDERGAVMADHCTKIRDLMALPASFEIKNSEALNSEYADFSPTYYNEGLAIVTDRRSDLDGERVYDWTNHGYLDVYFAKPAYHLDFWDKMSTPERMGNYLNQIYHDGPVDFSEVDNRVFLTRTLKKRVAKDEDNFRTNKFQLFSGALVEGDKIDYQAAPFNNEEYSTGHPAISPDGTRLVFASDRPGGNGSSDLYMVTINGQEWSDPVNLGMKINTFGNEVFPVWQNDTLLIFASDGLLGFGGLDLFETRYENGGWSDPANMLKPVNSPYDDFGLAFREGLNEGFFSSNRPGGEGSDDIYAFRNYNREDQPGMPGQQFKKLMISGLVKDKATLQPLENAQVFVLNTRTDEVLIGQTNKDGYFEAPAQKGLTYVVKAMKEGYLDDCIWFNIDENEQAENLKIPRDLLLAKYEVGQVFTVENIYYDLDKWFIREDAKPALDNLVRMMKQSPVTIELSSHTDSRASDEYNMELSFKRAESAVRYITLSGVNPARITAKGYGETMLINQCKNGVACSEAEHQANRRTEFKILSVEDPGKEPQVKLSDYIPGDIIPAQLFDCDFFKGCVPEKK